MQVLQGAVCPEVKMGLDDAVSAIASVTEVAMSSDLQVAKVYISVYSDPHGRDIAMKGLSRLEGYIPDPSRNAIWSVAHLYLHNCLYLHLLLLSCLLT